MRTIQLTFLSILSMASLSSHAVMMDTGQTSCTSARPNSLECMVTTTTSLPWLIVDGTNYDLNAAETQVQIFNEASGATTMRLLPSFADKLGVSTETLQAAIVKIGSEGKTLSAESINEALKK